MDGFFQSKHAIGGLNNIMCVYRRNVMVLIWPNSKTTDKPVKQTNLLSCPAFRGMQNINQTQINIVKRLLEVTASASLIWSHK